MHARAVNPAGVLASLEHRYGINREPLERQLREAIEEQNDLDRWVRRYAARASVWRKAARTLEYRREAIGDALDLLSGEIGGARFAPDAMVHLRARLEYLRIELDTCLSLIRSRGRVDYAV